MQKNKKFFAKNKNTDFKKLFKFFFFCFFKDSSNFQHSKNHKKNNKISLIIEQKIGRVSKKKKF